MYYVGQFLPHYLILLQFYLAVPLHCLSRPPSRRVRYWMVVRVVVVSGGGGCFGDGCGRNLLVSSEEVGVGIMAFVMVVSDRLCHP